MSEISIEPMALNLPEACRTARVGETKIREAIDNGELEVMRVGDRVLVEPEELRRWLRTKRTRAGRPVDSNAPEQG